jgi:tRNA pseudouridine38-40 synthase
MRYFMNISYDGTNFYGWQKQGNSENTIQSCIDNCLTMLLKHNVNSMGCGRTDSGVHAKQFYLHFDTDHRIDTSDLVYHVNRILPRSIVVHQLFEVNDDLHARFDALERSYVYRIKLVKDPFDFHHHYYTYKEPVFDLSKLNDLAHLILSASDFKSFCKTHSANKTNICHITRSEWIYDSHQMCYEYHITANRFLRGMIRLLVGGMLNVLRNRVTLESFRASLFEQNPLESPWSIDGNGLILYGIKYPFNLPANL